MLNIHFVVENQIKLLRSPTDNHGHNPALMKMCFCPFREAQEKSNMPAKKKKGEAKKGGTTTKENGEHKPIFLTEERENWVILDFRLLNWKYMNFTMKFKEDTRIFTIKKVLAKRHGRMTDLKICLNNFTESNEINDEMLTLLECGMRGEPQEVDSDGNPTDSNLPLYQIFYDFKPCEFGDPVLLYFSS